jgi:hypothetical protein
VTQLRAFWLDQVQPRRKQLREGLILALAPILRSNRNDASHNEPVL